MTDAEAKRDRMFDLLDVPGILPGNKTQNDYEWFIEWAAGSRRLIICFDDDAYSILEAEGHRIVFDEYGTGWPDADTWVARARRWSEQELTAAVEELVSATEALAHRLDGEK